MLEAIGSLTIIVAIIITLLYYVEYKGQKSRETELIREKYSKITHLRVQAILKEKQLESESDRPSELEHYSNKNLVISNIWKETNDEINKILNNPKERMLALKEIAEKEESNKKFEYERLQQMKDNRKFAIKYGYDEMIFRIFNSQDEVSRDEFIKGVMNDREVDKEEAIQITKECLDLYLISNLLKKSKLSIGHVLSSKEFKLTDSDLTIYEWRRRMGVPDPNEGKLGTRFNV